MWELNYLYNLPHAANAALHVNLVLMKNDRFQAWSTMTDLRLTNILRMSANYDILRAIDFTDIIRDLATAWLPYLWDNKTVTNQF